MSKEVIARGLTPIEDSQAFLDKGFEDEAGRHRQFVPDPGWARNPGKDWFGGMARSAMATAGSLRPIPGQPTARNSGLPPWSEIDAGLLRDYPAHQILRNVSDEEIERVFVETFGLEESADATVVNVLGEPVLIHHQLLAHLLSRGGHPEVIR